MRRALAISLLMHAAAGGALWFQTIEPPAATRAPARLAMCRVDEIPLDRPPPPPPAVVPPPAPAEDLTAPEPAAEPSVEWSEPPPVPAYQPRRPMHLVRLARPLPRLDPPPPAPPAAEAPPPRPAPRVHVARRPRPVAAAVGPVTPPRLDRARSPRPAYPLSARRLGLEGEVVIRARVSARGTVATAEVERSSGHAALDRAALAAVKRYRYAPARRAGQPVAYDVRVPVLFRLRR